MADDNQATEQNSIVPELIEFYEQALKYTDITIGYTDPANGAVQDHLTPFEYTFKFTKKTQKELEKEPDHVSRILEELVNQHNDYIKALNATARSIHKARQRYDAALNKRDQLSKEISKRQKEIKTEQIQDKIRGLDDSLKDLEKKYTQLSKEDFVQQKSEIQDQLKQLREQLKNPELSDEDLLSNVSLKCKKLIDKNESDAKKLERLDKECEQKKKALDDLEVEFKQLERGLQETDKSIEKKESSNVTTTVKIDLCPEEWHVADEGLCDFFDIGPISGKASYNKNSIKAQADYALLRYAYGASGRAEVHFPEGTIDLGVDGAASFDLARVSGSYTFYYPNQEGFLVADTDGNFRCRFAFELAGNLSVAATATLNLGINLNFKGKGTSNSSSQQSSSSSQQSSSSSQQSSSSREKLVANNTQSQVVSNVSVGAGGAVFAGAKAEGSIEARIEWFGMNQAEMRQYVLTHQDRVNGKHILPYLIDDNWHNFASVNILGELSAGAQLAAELSVKLVKGSFKVVCAAHATVGIGGGVKVELSVALFTAVSIISKCLECSGHGYLSNIESNAFVAFTKLSGESILDYCGKGWEKAWDAIWNDTRKQNKIEEIKSLIDDIEKNKGDLYNKGYKCIESCGIKASILCDLIKFEDLKGLDSSKITDYRKKQAQYIITLFKHVCDENAFHIAPNQDAVTKRAKRLVHALQAFMWGGKNGCGIKLEELNDNPNIDLRRESDLQDAIDCIFKFFDSRKKEYTNESTFYEARATEFRNLLSEHQVICNQTAGVAEENRDLLITNETTTEEKGQLIHECIQVISSLNEKYHPVWEIALHEFLAGPLGLIKTIGDNRITCKTKDDYGDLILVILKTAKNQQEFKEILRRIHEKGELTHTTNYEVAFAQGITKVRDNLTDSDIGEFKKLVTEKHNLIYWGNEKEPTTKWGQWLTKYYKKTSLLSALSVEERIQGFERILGSNKDTIKPSDHPEECLKTTLKDLLATTSNTDDIYTILCFEGLGSKNQSDVHSLKEIQGVYEPVGGKGKTYKVNKASRDNSSKTNPPIDPDQSYTNNTYQGIFKAYTQIKQRFSSSFAKDKISPILKEKKIGLPQSDADAQQMDRNEEAKMLYLGGDPLGILKSSEDKRYQALYKYSFKQTSEHHQQATIKILESFTSVKDGIHARFMALAHYTKNGKQITGSKIVNINGAAYQGYTEILGIISASKLKTSFHNLMKECKLGKEISGTFTPGIEIKIPKLGGGVKSEFIKWNSVTDACDSQIDSEISQLLYASGSYSTTQLRLRYSDPVMKAQFISKLVKRSTPILNIDKGDDYMRVDLARKVIICLLANGLEQLGLNKPGFSTPSEIENYKVTNTNITNINDTLKALSKSKPQQGMDYIIKFFDEFRPLPGYHTVREYQLIQICKACKLDYSEL